ncbi:MoaD/ThiS family protein [Lapillicoccus sp.]|jgi:molybdopterin synthase sulfur carrier subunit|uniref:MoaD/ThiS family protein n=1 Tax=Lapillicoccus sp. TaxID=1909287 RepID=UPI0025EC7072|nr:MoaD/ThiS family protein [Lapillicoccus sp.]
MSPDHAEERPRQPAVTVRYWAGARAAAGVGEDVVTGSSVREVTAAVAARRPALLPVLAVATLLVDGVRRGLDDLVEPGAVLEVLPPFAGG